MNVYRMTAWADFALFAALAAPFLGRLVVDLLLSLDASLFGAPETTPSALAYVMVQFLGILGAAFAFVRLQASDGAHLGAAVTVKIAAALAILAGILSGAPKILAAIAIADLAMAAAMLVWRRMG